MFVLAFHNKIKVKHFNEFLAQTPTYLMKEIMVRPKCYIKKEEGSAEKRAKDVKNRNI